MVTTEAEHNRGRVSAPEPPAPGVRRLQEKERRPFTLVLSSPLAISHQKLESMQALCSHFVEPATPYRNTKGSKTQRWLRYNILLRGGQMNYTGTKEFNCTVACASTDRWIFSPFKLGGHFHQAKNISDFRHAGPPRVTEYFLWTLQSEKSSHNSGKRSTLTTCGRQSLGLLGAACLTNKQYR